MGKSYYFELKQLSVTQNFFPTAVLAQRQASSVKIKEKVSWSFTCGQGWQYGTLRSEFDYYVPRTFNCTVPAYRTSVQFLKRPIPTYSNLPLQKKVYRTNVPFFLAKIEAYRTVPYCHPCFWLLVTLTDFKITSQSINSLNSHV